MLQSGLYFMTHLCAVWFILPPQHVLRLPELHDPQHSALCVNVRFPLVLSWLSKDYCLPLAFKSKFLQVRRCSSWWGRKPFEIWVTWLCFAVSRSASNVQHGSIVITGCHSSLSWCKMAVGSFLWHFFRMVQLLPKAYSCPLWSFTHLWMQVGPSVLVK